MSVHQTDLFKVNPPSPTSCWDRLQHPDSSCSEGGWRFRLETSLSPWMTSLLSWEPGSCSFSWRFDFNTFLFAPSVAAQTAEKSSEFSVVVSASRLLRSHRLLKENSVESAARVPVRTSSMFSWRGWEKPDRVTFMISMLIQASHPISFSRRRRRRRLKGIVERSLPYASLWANLCVVFSLTSVLSGIHRHEGQGMKPNVYWVVNIVNGIMMWRPRRARLSNYRRVIRLLCQVKLCIS